MPNSVNKGFYAQQAQTLIKNELGIDIPYEELLSSRRIVCYLDAYLGEVFVKRIEASLVTKQTFVGFNNDICKRLIIIDLLKD